MRNKPADRNIRAEGEGGGGPGTGAEIHSPVVCGEGSGEAGCSPAAHRDHGRAKKKHQEEGEPEADSYVLIIIIKSTFISNNFTILHHSIYTVPFVYFIIHSKR